MSDSNSTTRGINNDKTWLTADEANRRLSYDPLTGALTWKVARNSKLIGKETKSIDASGYIQVNICGTICKGHRLAWFIYYGQWPEGHIDHINGDRADNRIANLRVVTNAINCQNKREPLPANKLGVLGVTFNKGAYRASVMLNRKQHHLGRFSTIEEASAAYVSAKRILHDGCTL